MLHFEGNMPFSFEKFLKMTEGILSDRDRDVLKKIPEEYTEFEIGIKNELVKVRSERKHVDGTKYLRKDGYWDTRLKHIAMNAYKSPSIIEGEKILDMARWRAFDELAAGHYFDITFLTLYARKILILEKWHKINSANKAQALEESLSGV